MMGCFENVAEVLALLRAESVIYVRLPETFLQFQLIDSAAFGLPNVRMKDKFIFTTKI